MTTSPKYIVYKCNVCNRQTEIVLDGERPDPSRCNITEKCRGKLTRIGERLVRKFLFSPIVPGLKDFVPRGTAIIPAPQYTVPNPITVFTASGTGILAMSVLHRNVAGGMSEFSSTDDTGIGFIVERQNTSVLTPQTTTIRAVMYEISSNLLTAQKYIYYINGPVAIVEGRDNSPEGRNIRFSTSNSITVYVNGVKLDSSAYDRTIDNQITFSPVIYDSNNVVEVFVYQDLTEAIADDFDNDAVNGIDNDNDLDDQLQNDKVILEFKSLLPSNSTDLALRNLNCWGNYSTVIINDVERFTLFCTDLTKLNVNKSYGIGYFQVTDVDGNERKISGSDVFILLGKEPFSFRDKELYAYVAGTSLVNLQSILTYKQSPASGILYLTVDETAVTQVFNQITPTQLISSVQELTTIVDPATPLAGSENLTPKYILGPV